MDGMICPVLNVNENDAWVYCQEVNCAWWDYASQSCTLRVIANALKKVARG